MGDTLDPKLRAGLRRLHLLTRHLGLSSDTAGAAAGAAAGAGSPLGFASSAPASAQALGPVVAYVSDERYLAIPGVYLEFSAAGGSSERYAATSTATGAVSIDLPAGQCAIIFYAQQNDPFPPTKTPHRPTILR